MSGGANNITFTEKVYSTSTKVTAVALFILIFPVTIFLSGIGYIGTICSKSHSQIFNSYARNIQSVANQIDDNIYQQNTTSVTSLNTSEDRAATIIQKHFRGYLARKPHLPSGLYLQYHAQCERGNRN